MEVNIDLDAIALLVSFLAPLIILAYIAYRRFKISQKHKKRIESDWYVFMKAAKREDIHNVIKYGILLKNNVHMDSIHLKLIFEELYKLKHIEDKRFQSLKRNVLSQIKKWERRGNLV
ncbi:hypothetical protein [Aureivirga sp. CE67]|uniref:hypothetical protein n=1 Tax=Aureivirga sp. CE67 TaxID=1788983 RepID=UPI0018CB6880|nr:hypothetical protein [Aureivirga sp. CE67]